MIADGVINSIIYKLAINNIISEPLLFLKGLSKGFEQYLINGGWWLSNRDHFVKAVILKFVWWIA